MPYIHDKISTKRILTAVQADPDSKSKKAAEYPELVLETHFALSRFFDYALTKASAYNVALWVWSWNNYVSLKGQSQYAICKPGQIVDVDFGGMSYGDEFIFRHPGIVICECNNKVFLVPCSSSPKQGRDKAGNLLSEVVLIPGGSGLEFAKDTVALIYNARFIDKTRIMYNTKRSVTPSKFEEIINILFAHMFSDKNTLISEAEKLKEDFEAKSKEAENLTQELEKALSSKSDLEQQLQEMTNKYEDIYRQLRDQRAN